MGLKGKKGKEKRKSELLYTKWSRGTVVIPASIPSNPINTHEADLGGCDNVPPLKTDIK